MKVRIILETELEQLYALRNKILRVPLGLNLYDQDFSEEELWIKIGAFDNGNLIGCVMLSVINDNKIKLRQMAVDKDFQSMGVGKIIVAFAEKWCMENHFKTIELAARDEALGFYKKLNYQIEGEYFEEVGIKHLKMKKEL